MSTATLTSSLSQRPQRAARAAELLDSNVTTPESRPGGVMSESNAEMSTLDPSLTESATAGGSATPPTAWAAEDALNHGWRKVVRNFTPSWFAVTMGTGIVSILLNDIPFHASWLYWLSVIFFALNVGLFCAFTAISVLRYTLYPEVWKVMIYHPGQSLFLGTFPMGLATLVNLTVLICVPAWGSWAVTFAWALWWIDAVIALTVCMYLPFVIIRKHGHSHLGSMTAVWLLPVVSTIVASASGGLVAGVLENKQHALWTLIVSYILWGTGVPLAMVLLVIYFERLALHSLPSKEVIVSVFLPLGPLGQGGYAAMVLGKVAMNVMPITQSLVPDAGKILYVLGFLMAIVMWGFGLVWLFFAVATISTTPRFPFNMGWWGFTFPLGVYAVSTFTIGNELPSLFFRVLGTVFAVAVILLWVAVAIRTVQEVATGSIFAAPCLAQLKKEESREEPSP